jgi:hypothetical protein
MTIKLAIQSLTALVIFAIAIRETIQLSRHRNDAALRVLVLGLWCLTWSASVGIQQLELKELFNHLGRYVFNYLLDGTALIMGYCLATFFLLTRHDLSASKRRRAVVGELILLLLGLSIPIMLWWLAPATSWGYTPRSTAEYRANVPRLINKLTFDVWTLGYWLLGFWRGLLFMRHVRHLWTRWALGLVMAGAATFGIGVFANQLVIDLLHPLLPSAPQRFITLGKIYITALVAGQAAIAAGLALPTIAALVTKVLARSDRLAQQRYRKRITPLWQTLIHEFPHIVLPAHEERAEPMPDRRALEPGFARLLSEVTDGLGFLAPYYVAGGLDPRDTEGTRDPQVAARIVQGALRARGRPSANGRDGDVRSAPPYPRLVPDFPGWRHMASWMARVASAVDHRPDAPAAKGELAR